MYKVNKQDQIAWWLASQALRIATPTYRKLLAGAYEYGLRAAVRDAVLDYAPPENWRH